jgi:MPBQ/MSBQ methyltransferase
MRLIQHKREAYWFYRVLSLGYDDWINPLFWTPRMRDAALTADARRAPSALWALCAPGGESQVTQICQEDPRRAAFLRDTREHKAGAGVM